jgi:UDP-N-acetylglucosamine transferase subunit ALG13
VSLVLVMVGTDHHPFDRIVDWVDTAARRYPEHRFLVQHGDSRAPAVAEGSAFLPHGEIRRLLREADGVVCHGGPGTIMDARDAGHVPICVPRDPARGEHVDGHQQRFAALVHQAGVVTRAETVTEFQEALAGLLVPRLLPRPTRAALSPETVQARARAALELEGLWRPGRVGVPRPRRARAVVRVPLPRRARPAGPQPSQGA